MIDWLELAGAALWVLGLALCLAVLSMARYQANVDAESVFRRMQHPGLRAALASGSSLFCVGLLLVSDPWWQRGSWALAAAVSVVWAVRSWRGHRFLTGGES